MNAAIELQPVSPSLMRRRRTFLAPLWLLALGGILMLLARGALLELGHHDDHRVDPSCRKTARRHRRCTADTAGRVARRAPGADVRRRRTLRARAADLRHRHPALPADGRGAGAAAELSSPSSWTARAARPSSRAACCTRTEADSRSSSDTATPCRNSSRRSATPTRCPPIGDEEFDTMYVVTVPTIGKRFGPADEVLKVRRRRARLAQLDRLLDEVFVFGESRSAP